MHRPMIINLILGDTNPLIVSPRYVYLDQCISHLCSFYRFSVHQYNCVLSIYIAQLVNMFSNYKIGCEFF